MRSLRALRQTVRGVPLLHLLLASLELALVLASVGLVWTGPEDEVALLSGLLLAAALLLGCGVVLHLSLALRASSRRGWTGVGGAHGRSDFLADVGYAIRAPMNGIIGMTNLVLDGALAREQRSALEGVRSAAEGLLVVLGNVLDYAKLEAGRLDLEATSFDPRAVAYAALRSVGAGAHAKRLELLWQVDGDVPESVVGDPRRLQQVFHNLLDNAVRYTEEGEIAVRIRADGSAASGSSELPADADVVLACEVVDTGVGMDASHRAELFGSRREPRTRDPGGVGLGLVVADELVRRMGGELEVASEPGRGTSVRFRVRAGLDTSALRENAVAAKGELRDLRVLVVDDNASSRRILTGTLRTYRAVATAVETAPAALASLRDAAAGGRPFALVLIDLGIAGGSGVDLAWKIRSDATLGEPAIVGLTDLGGSVDEAAGAMPCVAKPTRPRDLLEAVQSAVAQLALERLAVPPEAQVESRRIRSLRVLLADDNRMDRTLGSRLLEKRGHVVTAVESGEAALAAIERGTFDLVLMDVQMPGIDGLEATHEIRKRERRVGAHLPIVALTAHEARGPCREAGMDAYVTKPVDAYEVDEVIRRLVPSLPLEDEAAQGEARPLDEDVALERAGGDHALLVDLAGMCLSDGPAALQRIREGLAGHDSKAVERAAHKLKGSLLVLAADPASEAAYRVEALGAQGALDQAAVALATLETELERLRPALARIAGSRLAGERSSPAVA
jgi:two-component system sensor histidine kinase/response regulator